MLLDNDLVDAVLITSSINRRYFTNFDSSDGMLLITKENSYLLLDFRYIEAARQQVSDIEVVLFESLSDSLGQILKNNNIKSVAFENELLTLKDAAFFESILKKLGVRPIFNDKLDYYIKQTRIIKSDEEIFLIKKAEEISELSLNKVIENLRPGMTEREIALEIEFLMRKQGAEAVAFDLIVVSGKNSSLPHGVPGDKKVACGDLITFDIGARYNGYNSDMTRTICLGKANEEQRQVYNTVLEAQKRAIDMVHSGISCDKVDLCARNYIYEAGYKGFFGHATGHGVGVQIHEAPSVSPRSSTILESNMIITVEPGIYLPNKFGVRIEDMLIVKENGCENITQMEKNLIEL